MGKSIEEWDSLQAFSVHKIIEGALQLGWDIRLLAEGDTCIGMMLGQPQVVKEVVIETKRNGWITDSAGKEDCRHCGHKESLHDDDGCAYIDADGPCFCERNFTKLRHG